MPFDGVSYTSAPLIPPMAHHPQAIATGDALGGALEAAYYCARKSGRLIGYQTGFILARRPAYYTVSLTGVICYQQAFVDWTRMLRWLPEHATAIRCLARFRCYDRGGGVKLRGRVVATDGTTTETGPTNDDAELVAEADERLELARTGTIPFYEYTPVYELECRVELANLTLAQDVQIALQAYAMDGTDTEKVGHWLHGALLWWESEG